ncbi:uncharacterized protein LOC106881607 [Octopus bimaculoides]|uniref:Alpha-type protein kinase domain-containing protein n=1 Tax=Octopus bimaculoides TaxID=37653 RepID=A0A0L8FRR4_OCTBM|nr:uncharacterized protein LOC106881607 [Octopus bimaculoides]|eukprot:XP_014787554.1 PREDICTED: uncharacterized protein LOC106881607 [Octopus bimaculoides]
MDNETLSFQYNNENYFANFSYKPSVITKDYLLYDGVLNGSGIHRGNRCIIRVLKTKPHSKNAWKSYLNTRALLHKAKSYFVSRSDVEFFQVPDYTEALIDRISLITKFTVSRHPVPDETVLIDHYKGAHGEEKLTSPSLDAISHFTFLESKGQTILTNFQGFRINRKTICITGADCVAINAETFLKQHKCNKHCKILQNVPQLIPQVTYIQDKNQAPSYHSIVTARASLPHIMYGHYICDHCDIYNHGGMYNHCGSYNHCAVYNHTALMHSSSVQERETFGHLHLRPEPSAPPFDEVFYRAS